MTQRRNIYKSQAQGKKIADILSFVAVIIVGALVLLPIYWIFRSSLMANDQIYHTPPYFIPPTWEFSNYPKALELFKYWLYLGNTMTIIVPSVIAGTLTATMCGYAFARLRFPGKKFLFTLCVGSMFLPPIVTLIPLYIMWTNGLNLHNSFLPIILPYFCGGGAFNIFLLRQFIMTIPRDLDEAAKIDGAGYWRTLVQIIVPIIRPAMIVVGLLLFIFLWNDMLQQMVYLADPKKYTIAVGLTFFRGALKANWGGLMAATCMTFAPGVIFYLIGQKYFIEGIVMTGMKN